MLSKVKISKVRIFFVLSHWNSEANELEKRKVEVQIMKELGQALDKGNVVSAKLAFDKLVEKFSRV